MLVIGFIALLYLLVGIALWRLSLEMCASESHRTRLENAMHNKPDAADHPSPPDSDGTMHEQDEYQPGGVSGSQHAGADRTASQTGNDLPSPAARESPPRGRAASN